MAGTFEIKMSSDNQFMFNLKATDGEIILTSELYTRKENAEKGIEAVKFTARNRAWFEERTSTDGKPCFVLKAASGEILGTSELYSSEAARDSGIASVMEHAPDAQVLELV